MTLLPKVIVVIATLATLIPSLCLCAGGTCDAAIFAVDRSVETAVASCCCRVETDDRSSSGEAPFVCSVDEDAPAIPVAIATVSNKTVRTVCSVVRSERLAIDQPRGGVTVRCRLCVWLC